MARYMLVLIYEIKVIIFVVSGGYRGYWK